MNNPSRIWWLVLIGLVVIAGLVVLVSNRLDTNNQDPTQYESHDPTSVAQLVARRDPDVPELPFPDNPDPSQCGIPSQWLGDTRAWLNGFYQGELVQPTVFLYDGHSRLHITGQAPHGTEVKVILYQNNPILNYYLVKVVSPEGSTEGWIPEPFLSFEPIGSLQES